MSQCLPIDGDEPVWRSDRPTFERMEEDHMDRLQAEWDASRPVSIPLFSHAED